MNRHRSPHYKSSIINKNLEKNIRSYPTELIRQNIGGLSLKVQQSDLHQLRML